MIVLDACVVIAYLDADDVHHARAQGLWEREIDEDFVMGTWTIVEVLVAPARVGRADDALGILDALGVQEHCLPAGCAPRLAELRAHTRLKMPDCYVLLTAQEAGARLATFDERLAEAAGARGVPILAD